MCDCDCVCDVLRRVRSWFFVASLPPPQVPEVLRCLFHTILFNRALGPIKPEHVRATFLLPSTSLPLHSLLPSPSLQKESELFDVVYAKVPGDDINATFEAQIAKFNSSLVPLGPDLARGQMVVSFYNKRKVKKLFGFASSSEKVYWEQWQIRLIVNTRPREPRTDPSSGERTTFVSMVILVLRC